MSLSKIIRKYLKAHFLLVCASLAIIVLDIIFTVIPPLILEYIVDNVIVLGLSDKLIYWSLIFTASYLVLAVFEFLKGIVLVIMSQGICKDIRLSLMNKIHDMDYLTLSSYDTGSLEVYFNNDVNTINNLVSGGVISMFIDFFKMFGIIVSLFYLSVNVGWLLLAVMPFIFLFTLFVRKRMYQAQLNAQNLIADVNHLVLESVENVEAIKSYTIYPYMNKKFEKVIKSYYDASQVSKFYDAIFGPVMQIICYGLIAGIIMAYASNPNLFSLTIGAVVALPNLITNIFSPLQSLGMEIQTLQQSQASINRIRAFLAVKSNNKIIDKRISVEAKIYTLEFNHVDFSYDGLTTVIKDFSMKLVGNEKLTIKGASGVGKSTLFKLAYGLLTPTSGRVTINGSDVSLINEETRNRLFGIVYQDSFFSEGTIREELTFGDNRISDQKIYKILSKVGLSRIKNIDALINEQDYSSGELAILNIARTLIKNPPIIFLDEMNAKIDPKTALQIIGLLNNYASDSMILSISHYGTQIEHTKELELKTG